MKILLVDDDDTIQEYVKELLETNGFECDGALDVGEFKEKIKNNAEYFFPIMFIFYFLNQINIILFF